MRQFLTLILLFIVFFLGSYWVRSVVETQRKSHTLSSESEVLYLPNGEGLQLISFGFKNALANVLWFKTINYFGKHFKSDRNYTWLKLMCELVVTLDPKAKHVYEFGALMLAWEASDPRGSISLLSRAIDNFPSDWRLKYLRGFNYFFFMKDSHAAIEDLESAARLPDGPPFLSSLAAKIKSQSMGVNAGIEFLKSMIENSKDPTAKVALERKLMELIEKSK